MSQNTQRALAQMMVSGEFSDLKFVCNGQEFKVHKAVVCAQSPVIKAAVTGGFKESETNVIEMNSFEPSTVRCLVQFLYTGDYDDHEDDHGPPDPTVFKDNSDKGVVDDVRGNRLQTGGGAEGSTGHVISANPRPQPSATASLLGNVNANYIGEYYGISELVSLANEKAKSLLQNDGDRSWLASLPKAIDSAFQSIGDHEILGILASATAENLSEELLDSPEFTGLAALTDFSVDVLNSCFQKMRLLAKENETIKESLRKEKKNAEEYQCKLSKLTGCLELLSKTEKCRNCRTEFHCHLVGDHSFLRCTKCGCKHYKGYG